MLIYSLVLGLTLTSDLTDVRTPWFEHYPHSGQQGIEHMRTQASPMDPDNGVKLIFVTVIGMIMIMTDLLVSGLGRPAWAIAPPATLFLVPALGLGTDTGVISFCYIAVGYLAILIAEGLNGTARWTRGLSRDSAEGFGTAMPVVWRAAGYLAVPAIIATIVLGFVLPTLSLPGFGFGNGPGARSASVDRSTLDLRRNLNQPEDRDVIEYQTNRSGRGLPALGLAATVDRERLEQCPDTAEQRTRPPGRSRVGATSLASGVQTTIRVLDFASQYLPLPYAPRTFDAPGDWRYDANSLIVVNAGNRAQDLRRLTYTVESVDIEPDSQ